MLDARCSIERRAVSDAIVLVSSRRSERVIRPLLVCFGVLEIVVPERIVDLGERVALENPGAGELRRSTLPIARLEGVAFLRLVLRDDRPPAGVARLFGLLGIPAALAPRRFAGFGLWMAYENADELRVKPWVVRAIRALGASYLALALFAGRANPPWTEADSDRHR